MGKGTSKRSRRRSRKGREEGWREGRITLILSLLKKVLGRVSSELETKILALNDKEIEKLTQDLLNMKAQSDLEQWFQIREKNNKEN